MNSMALSRRAARLRAGSAGFSLLELMIAVAVFLAISSASFTLFSRHEALIGRNQALAGLNLGLRSALAQMQLDLANAGAGMVLGANIPNSPVGATIVNSVVATGSSCISAGAYTATCFDAFNIIAIDPNTPALHPQNNTGVCVDTTGTSIYIAPQNGLTAAQIQALFGNGDQVMLLNGSGSQFTTTLLTAAPTIASGNVRLFHNATGVGAVLGANTALNDPLAITTDAAMGTPPLGNSFCPASDWIIKLKPIKYFVDASSTADPQLKRTQAGTTLVVMDQVIGFKVGATIWNGSTEGTYDYKNADYASNYYLIRSMRISLIARTSPSTDPAYNFVNPFDGGKYQVQGASIVVNPRNMSMNDQ